jgi:hypothetical protein
MMKTTFGVIGGLVAFAIIAIVSGVIVREAWPEYASVAEAMTFTLPMMFTRLAIGAIATLIAGWFTALIAGPSHLARLMLGAVLLVVFIPEHIMLWNRFPVWYHLTFLASLLPLTYLGGKITDIGVLRRRARSQLILNPWRIR